MANETLQAIMEGCLAENLCPMNSLRLGSHSERLQELTRSSTAFARMCLALPPVADFVLGPVVAAAVASTHN